MGNREVIISNLETAMQCVEEARVNAEEKLHSGNVNDYSEAFEKFRKEVNDANKLVVRAKYCEFLDAPSPMLAAVETFWIDVFKPKEKRNKETNKVVGLELTKKQVRVDLEDFCEFAELPTDWAKDSDRLLALLSLRESKIFEIRPSDLAAKNSYFVTAYREKMEGGTPDSNTQITKLLQKIVDETIFVDNGKGENVFKCTVHDLYYIHDCITKMETKEKCTITTMKERPFKTVILSVLAHKLGEPYKVSIPKPKKAKETINTVSETPTEAAKIEVAAAVAVA